MKNLIDVFLLFINPNEYFANKAKQQMIISIENEISSDVTRHSIKKEQHHLQDVKRQLLRNHFSN
jgi:hypothetical protein